MGVEITASIAPINQEKACYQTRIDLNLALGGDWRPARETLGGVSDKFAQILLGSVLISLTILIKAAFISGAQHHSVDLGGRFIGFRNTAL